MLRYKFREAADLQGEAADLQRGANAPTRPPPPPLNATRLAVRIMYYCMSLYQCNTYYPT